MKSILIFIVIVFFLGSCGILPVAINNCVRAKFGKDIPSQLTEYRLNFKNLNSGTVISTNVICETTYRAVCDARGKSSRTLRINNPEPIEVITSIGRVAKITVPYCREVDHARWFSYGKIPLSSLHKHLMPDNVYIELNSESGTNNHSYYIKTEEKTEYFDIDYEVIVEKI